MDINNPYLWLLASGTTAAFLLWEGYNRARRKYRYTFICPDCNGPIYKWHEKEFSARTDPRTHEPRGVFVHKEECPPRRYFCEMIARPHHIPGSHGLIQI